MNSRLLGVLVLLSLSLVPKSQASPVAQTPAEFHLHPVAQLGGDSEDIAADKERLFLGSGQRVVSFDPTGPGSPIRLGESPPLGHTVESLALYGNVLIVALGSDGLSALDVGDVAAPHVIPFHAAVDGTADLIRIEDDRLYVRDDTSRTLVFFDLAGWPNVERLGEVPSRQYGSWDVDGTLLVSAYFDFYGYFEAFDMTLPTKPRLIASERLEGNPCGAVLVGDHALVAIGAYDRTFGEHWRIDDYDFSTPASPRLRGSARMGGGHVRCNALTGNHERAVMLWNLAYSSEAALSVMEVSESDPYVVGSLPLLEVGRMVMDDDRLYMTDSRGGGLFVFSVESPKAPTLVGNYDTVGRLTSVSTDDSWVAVVDSLIEHFLHVVDVSDPLAPRQLEPVALEAEVATIEDEWVYAAGEGVLEAVEIRDDRLVRRSAVDLSGSAQDVASDDGRIYVAADEGPVQVYDHKDRAELRLVAEFPEITSAIKVGLVDDTLYAITNTYRSPIQSSVWFVETEPIEAAVIRSHLDFDHETRSAATDGQYLFLSSGFPVHVRSFDLIDPAHPALLGEIALPCCGASKLAYRKGRLYATGNRSVVSIDVADPASMRVLGEQVLYELGANNVDAIAVDAAPDGDSTFLYLASGEGLEVLRDGDPPAAPAARVRLQLPWAFQQ